ncbi:MAG TPA: PadR family transcriptional regulator [Acidimicrobiales bacterium]|jgi:PadR family transcriptional regulator PadR|nr:PadR family transcriptional regulator [Acidimicrobiales bacterium]
MSSRVEPAPIVISGSYLRCCLLLLIAEAPAHGYDLADRLSGLGLADVDSAAVYRALRALDEEGLVESWWEESGSGPVRRRYRISAEGLTCLEAWAASVGQSASRLSSFVARHRRLRAVSAVGA